MQFEDTGLGDTPLMRRAFEVSWAHAQDHFQKMQLSGRAILLENAEEYYRETALGAVSALGLEGDHISDDVIICSLISPAYNDSWQNLSDFPENIVAMTDMFFRKNIVALTLERKNIPHEDIRNTVNFSREEIAILKAAIFTNLKMAELFLRNNEVGYLFLAWQLIQIIPQRLLFIRNFQPDEAETNLDRAMKAKYKKLLESFHKRVSSENRGGELPGFDLSPE